MRQSPDPPRIQRPSAHSTNTPPFSCCPAIAAASRSIDTSSPLFRPPPFPSTLPGLRIQTTVCAALCEAVELVCFVLSTTHSPVRFLPIHQREDAHSSHSSPPPGSPVARKLSTATSGSVVVATAASSLTKPRYVSAASDMVLLLLAARFCFCPRCVTIAIPLFPICAALWKEGCSDRRGDRFAPKAPSVTTTSCLALPRSSLTDLALFVILSVACFPCAQGQEDRCWIRGEPWASQQLP